MIPNLFKLECLKVLPNKNLPRIDPYNNWSRRNIISDFKYYYLPGVDAFFIDAKKQTYSVHQKVCLRRYQIIFNLLQFVQTISKLSLLLPYAATAMHS